MDAIALRCQIRIEPARRRYSDAEAERLNDLFGDTQRWADTLKPLQFTTVSVMVPGFTGSTEIDLPVMLSYDLEIGSTRYFAGLEDGEIPLLLLFSGTVFTTAEGRLQVQQVPWSKEASYRLPVSVWREAIDVHFPNSAWIRMSLQTLDELQRFKTREALPTWDATLAALLGPGADERGAPAMRLDSAHLEHARRVADAILYEGYLLYPYRGSAQKNQARFQFGVLVPPAYAEVDDCEPSASQTECLVECPDDAQVQVLVRFLQLQRRIVQAAPAGDRRAGARSACCRWTAASTPPGTRPRSGSSRRRPPSAALLGQDRRPGVPRRRRARSARTSPTPTAARAGRLTRRWAALDGLIRLGAERVAGPYGALRLRVRVENHTAPPAPPRTRDDGPAPRPDRRARADRGAAAGRSCPMTDPPEWAAAEVAACVNIGTWPVLAGPADCRDLVLSSPVILYDHPEVAAESAGDLFDATEIDEILTLRTLALTDAEKREARATDPRAAEIMDRLDDHAAGDAGAHARGDPLPEVGARPGPGADRPAEPGLPGAAGGFGDRRSLTRSWSGRRCPGGTRARTPRCHPRPTTSSSTASGSPAAARSGCARAPGAPTRRTCSWSGARRGRGRPARRRRPGARGGDPGPRSRRRPAAQPRPVPVLRPRRDRAHRARQRPKPHRDPAAAGRIGRAHNS